MTGAKAKFVWIGVSIAILAGVLLLGSLGSSNPDLGAARDLARQEMYHNPDIIGAPSYDSIEQVGSSRIYRVLYEVTFRDSAGSVTKGTVVCTVNLDRGDVAFSHL